LVVLAITVVWGQVGGQDLFALMPWYDKLVLTFSLALVIVLGTVAAVSRERSEPCFRLAPFRERSGSSEE
jgi:hypothetical protein